MYIELSLAKYRMYHLNKTPLTGLCRAYNKSEAQITFWVSRVILGIVEVLNFVEIVITFI